MPLYQRLPYKTYEHAQQMTSWDHNITPSVGVKCLYHDIIMSSPVLLCARYEAWDPLLYEYNGLPPFLCARYEAWDPTTECKWVWDTLHTCRPNCTLPTNHHYESHWTDPVKSVHHWLTLPRPAHHGATCGNTTFYIVLHSKSPL